MGVCYEGISGGREGCEDGVENIGNEMKSEMDGVLMKDGHLENVCRWRGWSGDSRSHGVF